MSIPLKSLCKNQFGVRIIRNSNRREIKIIRDCFLQSDVKFSIYHGLPLKHRYVRNCPLYIANKKKPREKKSRGPLKFIKSLFSFI